MTLKKKSLDIFFLFIILPFATPVILLISFLIFFFYGKPIFFLSRRIGYKNKIFLMYKFRTMKNRTPLLATHLLNSPQKYITKIGFFLRKSSLDELPQIFNILKGEMSFVGPRPALFNQRDLIAKRTKFHIHTLYPGITGWAQVNGRDNLDIKKKVKYDIYYRKNISILLDLKILVKTIHKIFKTTEVYH